MNGAAALCDGAEPDPSPGMNGSNSRFVDCPLARPVMMKAVRAAAPRPAPSGRARIEPAKTLESRRSFVLSIVHFS